MLGVLALASATAVVATSTVAMAHTAGDQGHDHPLACIDEHLYITTEDGCIIYAEDGHTISSIDDIYMQNARLSPDVTPESVFVDPEMVLGGMDISAESLQSRRVFYDSTHFVSRSSSGEVWLSSTGSVYSGDSILYAIKTASGSTSSAAEKLVETGFTAGDKQFMIRFTDGALCQLGKFGSSLNYDSSGYFWGRYPDQAAGRTKACIQAKIRIQFTDNDGNQSHLDFWLKDNANGRSSVFSEDYPSHNTAQEAGVDSSGGGDGRPPVTVTVAAQKKRVSENNGKARFTVSLSRPLSKGEAVRVPLRVTGGRAHRDWNIRLRASESSPGVKRTEVGSFSELLFTEGGQTATLVLIGRPDDGDGDRTIKIAFGKGKRKPASAGVAEGIALGNQRIRIKIVD
ncbi:MAG: hypothetical protein OXT07_16425 [bacterium]|nr:hypothetical protein [bacterium]MDE0217466.1 hypothetical protein [bacterium]